jgi:PAS domain S-box-containing protein
MTKPNAKAGMVRQLSRKLMPLAVGIALLIAVLAPVTYWLLEHHKLKHMAETYAEDLADKLQLVALESPTLWKYQTYKFIAITEGFHPAIEVSGFRILDDKGELITGHDYQQINWESPEKNRPFTRDLSFTLGTAPIIFNDRQVGTVEVLADDTPIVRTSVLLFGFWSLAGITLAVLVYRFPVTVVRKLAGEIEVLLLTTQQSEEKYRSIFEYADDIIYLLNPDSTFRSLNPAFEQITGWTPEEWIGKPFLPIVHPDDLPYASDIFSKTLAGESSPSFELRLARKSGVYFDADLCITPLGGNLITGALGIVRDVTERKRAEDEIRKLNEELETKVKERTQQLQETQEELVRKEKLAILGQLSGSVGHELRNPLGVMSNAVYFLKIVHADADAMTREYLDIIKKEIDNSLRIITDLLDFARTRTPQTKPVTVRELTDTSIARCAIPENIDLQTEIPDKLPLLRVDPLQMGQVLMNFITNAVQAMPEGGALRVAARFAGAIHELPLQKQKTDDFIAISVTDTGEGISPENLNKLFQPLFTTKAKGIGLGLVVCKNLVTANNGRIEVESVLDQGTTFTVLLPIEKGEL